MIIRCSDVGWPLKSEMALTGTVCLSVGLCGGYSATVAFTWIPLKWIKSAETNQCSKPPPVPSTSPSSTKLILCFLGITLHNSQPGNNYFCVHYVMMVQNWRAAYFLHFTWLTHALTYKIWGAELRGRHLNRGFCVNLNWAVIMRASDDVEGLLQGTQRWTYTH